MRKAILGGALLVTSTAFASISSLPVLDVIKLHDLEVERETKGVAPHFAVPNSVYINAMTSTEWKQVGDNMVWTHHVSSPNAVSLNFGFTKFKLSPNAKVEVYAQDFSRSLKTITANENNQDNVLYTAVLEADEAVIELTVPASEFNQNEFVIGKINQGFRTFGETTQKSGSCNVDVVCKQGDNWRNEINAVGVISNGGYSFCTGFMVNNTAQDRTPYFMTANHCDVGDAEAKTLVVYWNYQSSKCGGARNGQHNQYQSGAVHLASSAPSDFTLLKLNSKPEEKWNVHFAGWDRSGAEAPNTTVIHHPNTDEKAISYSGMATVTASYGGDEVPGDGTHVKVIDYDWGTTEPGSSGSPLFDNNHRVIGQLHGGGAACGNDEPDWYGRISVSWEGQGRKGTRLKDYLDASNTGAKFVDTI